MTAKKDASVIVGGKLHINSAMEMINLLRKAGVKVGAIDPLGTDIDIIVKKTKELDYLLLDRHSSISTRLKLIRCLRHIKCNIILFKLNKNINKTKFYSLYTPNPDSNARFESVLKECFHTNLRIPCSKNKNKFKYQIYLFWQAIADFKERLARRYYLSHI